MREIKFRGWINKLDKWADGCMVNGEGGFVAYYNGVEYYDADLEQFTGISDKNGKEIYESDIVKFDVVASERGPEKFGQTGIVQDVPRYGWGIGGYSPVWTKNAEVIGNIHENPELLNEAV